MYKEVGRGRMQSKYWKIRNIQVWQTLCRLKLPASRVETTDVLIFEHSHKTCHRTNSCLPAQPNWCFYFLSRRYMFAQSYIVNTWGTFKSKKFWNWVLYHRLYLAAYILYQDCTKLCVPIELQHIGSRAQFVLYVNTVNNAVLIGPLHTGDVGVRASCVLGRAGQKPCSLLWFVDVLFSCGQECPLTAIECHSVSDIGASKRVDNPSDLLSSTLGTTTVGWLVVVWLCNTLELF